MSDDLHAEIVPAYRPIRHMSDDSGQALQRAVRHVARAELLVSGAEAHFLSLAGVQIARGEVLELLDLIARELEDAGARLNDVCLDRDGSDDPLPDEGSGGTVLTIGGSA